MDEKQLKAKFKALEPVLNEVGRRRWAAAEARAIGRGGLTLVSKATGISAPTIRKGLKELKSKKSLDSTRQRAPGAGRKSLVSLAPDLLRRLETLISPATRGDPESPLRWTSKSTEKLANELSTSGCPISADTVGRLLVQQGYSLQGLRKSNEGASHPDRDLQFKYIAICAAEFQQTGQPVISVDTKKKELVGPFKQGGKEYQPEGKPVPVNVYDFPDMADGKAIPYGVYDLLNNEAWVGVGVSHDTPAFAVNTIREWWVRMGAAQFAKATRLMITADSGGSNSSRSHQWKLELQKLAKEINMEIHVSHFPPGTSKWNKIEHRLFSQITMNWRGRPLETFEVIVSLIANTTNKSGLKVNAALDGKNYPTGKKATKGDLAQLHLVRSAFHGEWNYVLRPD